MTESIPPVFNEITWELVKNQRPETLVVDGLHGYGIIMDRVQGYFDLIRSAENAENRGITRVALAAIGAAAQMTAECLGLVREQQSAAEVESEAVAVADYYKNAFRQLVNTIRRDCTKAPEQQKGIPRFKYEFSPDLLKWLMEIAEQNTIPEPNDCQHIGTYVDERNRCIRCTSCDEVVQSLRETRK